MACDLKVASAEQARDSVQSAMATVREEMDKNAREHTKELEELQRQLSASQEGLQTLRARMLVDLQDHAAVESELELARTREASQQSIINMLQGRLSVQTRPIGSLFILCVCVCVDSLMGFLNILGKNNYSGKIW